MGLLLLVLPVVLFIKVVRNVQLVNFIFKDFDGIHLIQILGKSGYSCTKTIMVVQVGNQMGCSQFG